METFILRVYRWYAPGALLSAMETGTRSVCECRATYHGFKEGRGVGCLFWVRSAYEKCH
jgi:hypothetical protein